MTTKEPNWYINSSTGLVIINNGYIVEWEKYKKCMPEHDLNIYLKIPCSCVLCTYDPSKSRKRTRSVI